MKPVTIDNLDIKEHIRWAQDRAIHDPTLVQEAQSLSPFPEIAGTSAIYSSQLEELFEWEKGMHPWANFAPPQTIALFNKRFFSFRLFPNIYWKEKDEEQEDQEQEDDENNKHPNLIEQILAVEKSSEQSHTIFEKDKSSILSMLESIQSINDMLAQITSRKLQYQKG